MRRVQRAGQRLPAQTSRSGAASRQADRSCDAVIVVRPS